MNDATGEAPDAAATRLRRWVRWSAVAVGAVGLMLTPWWGPRLLSYAAYFHVQTIDVRGVRYAEPEELIAALKIDSSTSVWASRRDLVQRVRAHPLVEGAEIERRLPNTLVVYVRERLPVALAADADTLTPVDVSGRVLPVNPALSLVDVPVLLTAAARDTAILRVLDGVRTTLPQLWDRLSAVSYDSTSGLQLHLQALVIRTRADVTVARLADIFPVEADLAQRRKTAAVIDLRFRDQVLVTLP